MKRLGVITILLIHIVLVFACANFTHPDENLIKKEFYLRNPNTEIIGIKLVSDEVAIATYKVEFRNIETNEVNSKDFTLQQCLNWDWKSDYKDCDKK